MITSRAHRFNRRSVDELLSIFLGISESSIKNLRNVWLQRSMEFWKKNESDSIVGQCRPEILVLAAISAGTR